MPSHKRQNLYINKQHAPMQAPHFRRFQAPGDGAAGNLQSENGYQHNKTDVQPVNAKSQSEKDLGDDRRAYGPTRFTTHNSNYVRRHLPPSIRIDDTADQKSTPDGSFTSTSESNGNDSTSSPPSSPGSLPGNHFSKRRTLATLPDDYDLAAPMDDGSKLESLETVSELLFSVEHLKAIFDHPSSLLSFTTYLTAHRPNSVPVLTYYLDAIKALQAITYANAISKALEPIYKHDLMPISAKTFNSELDEKAENAFSLLAQHDLPAYVTFMYIEVVKSRIRRPATMTQPSHLPESSSGFAEVFCLTDPSRPDNPIVFASKAFYYMTQYSMRYTLGKNCRFLQGPKTNPASLQRIRDSVKAGREHCEVILNYRRDGSPFLNLLMHAPLYDHLGKIRYFMGAQIDVGSVLDDNIELESLRRVITKVNGQGQSQSASEAITGGEKRHELKKLVQMLDMQELRTVRELERQESIEDEGQSDDTQRRIPGARMRENLSKLAKDGQLIHHDQGTLLGLYNNYLLIRPYPSLHVLFASPSLSKPGILQSPIMNRIGGSSRVRDELTQALSESREVTAKIRWISPTDEEDQNRWIHFTPLIGSKDQTGVWMAILEDSEPISNSPTSDTPTSDPLMNQTIQVKPNLGMTNPIPEEPSDTEEEPHHQSAKTVPGHHAQISWGDPETAPELRKPLLNWESGERKQSLDWNRGDSKPSLDWNRNVPGSPMSERSFDTQSVEVSEEYESLEERLRKKRQRDAVIMMDQPGMAFRRTYKSLAPVTTESILTEK